MIESVVLLKFLKFCAVGFSGMVIDFGTTWILKEKVKINKYFANACGFILAATSNYFLNRIWTFESINEQIVSEYFTFLLIALAGLGINSMVLWFLSDKIKLNFYFSKLIATAVVTVWNFGMNFLITFSQ